MQIATYKMGNPEVIGAKEEGVNYVDRHVIRVVAFDAAGKIVIIHAKRDNYYKLPGGGIDPVRSTTLRPSVRCKRKPEP